MLDPCKHVVGILLAFFHQKYFLVKGTKINSPEVHVSPCFEMSGL
jgi:hypothetical protein